MCRNLPLVDQSLSWRVKIQCIDREFLYLNAELPRTLRYRQSEIAIDLVGKSLNEDLPLQHRLGWALDVIQSVTGWQRGAFVCKRAPGERSMLIAHAQTGASWMDFHKDIRNVEALIASQARPGVIATVLDSGSYMVLDDVEADSLYVPGDLAMRSELCVATSLGKSCRLALNVESRQRGAFDRTFLACATHILKRVAPFVHLEADLRPLSAVAVPAVLH
ncbi:MAG: hypothetical protein HKN18_14110 [Silicimonas sp.]|nr:hypothetical protein [Silicimonas sp.]